MAKYRVWAEMTSYCYLDVEARNEDAAREIAEDADGGLFHMDDNMGDWRITDVDPLDDELEADVSEKEWIV